MSENNAPKKKSIFKKWWFWVLVVILIGAYGSSKNNPKSTSTSAPAATEKAAAATEKPAATEKAAATAAPTKAPEKTEFAIGEAVQLKDNKLTVLGVEKSKGGQFDKPKDGKEFVIVNVQIENAGKDKISYNPFDFKMANSQGQITDGAFTTVNTKTALESGELAPGGKVTGTIAFEQPTGDAKLQLQYSPSFWSNKTIKVNLQ